MGILVYGAADEYDIDDRVLAHLKVAIAAVLQERPAFLVNWTIAPEAGSGRVSILVSANVPLQFLFHGNRAPQLNAQWVRTMIATSPGQRGMVVIAEEDLERYQADPGSFPTPFQGGIHRVRGRSA